MLRMANIYLPIHWLQYREEVDEKIIVMTISQQQGIRHAPMHVRLQPFSLLYRDQHKSWL